MIQNVVIGKGDKIHAHGPEPRSGPGRNPQAGTAFRNRSIPVRKRSLQIEYSEIRLLHQLPQLLPQDAEGIRPGKRLPIELGRNQIRSNQNFHNSIPFSADGSLHPFSGQHRG